VYIIYLKFHRKKGRGERLSGEIEFLEYKGDVSGALGKSQKHISSLSNPIYLLTSIIK
jgi:hypothetical protein